MIGRSTQTGPLLFPVKLDSKYIEGKGDRDRDRQKNTNITQYLSSKQELAK